MNKYFILVVSLFIATTQNLYAESASMPVNPAVNETKEQSKKIADFYRDLNIDHMELVEQFYDKNAEFTDPVVHVQGVQALHDYYAGLYKNVKSIRFDFSSEVAQGNDHVVMWKMTLLADSLNGGKEFAIDGNSFIRFGGPDGKVIFHHDYFDMGAFIYERIPVLGRVIRYIKAKMSSH